MITTYEGQKGWHRWIEMEEHDWQKYFDEEVWCDESGDEEQKEKAFQEFLRELKKEENYQYIITVNSEEFETDSRGLAELFARIKNTLQDPYAADEKDRQVLADLGIQEIHVQELGKCNKCGNVGYFFFDNYEDRCAVCDSNDRGPNP